MTFTALVVCALASWRLTTLLTVDTVTVSLRSWVGRRFPPVGGRPAAVAVLVHCTRCLSVWVAAVVVGVGWRAGLVDGWRWWLFGWWACAGASALAADVLS